MSLSEQQTSAKQTMKPASVAVVVVYGTAFLQGLTMVSFPASGTVLKETVGLTDAQYGLIFIPQIIATIVGSLAGGALAVTLGLRKLLAVAPALVIVSQLLFLTAVMKLSGGGAFAAVMAATGLFGLSFGLGAAPLNTFPGLFFTKKGDAALLALHTLLGLGLSAGPLLVGPLAQADLWFGYPSLLIGLGGMLLVGAMFAPLPAYDPKAQAGETDAEGGGLYGRRLFWIFCCIVLLYAFAEGTFSNWAVIFLHEAREVPPAGASLALSVFWAMIAAGRLLVSMLLLKVEAEWVWLLLPALMIAAFALLPLVNSTVAGVGAFAFAGLACSAFFPLTVGLAAKRFPQDAAKASSMMIAALMSGVGLGTFIIGPLRAVLTFEQLYAVSMVYPAGAFLLALITVAGMVRQSGALDRACKLVLKAPCR